MIESIALFFVAGLVAGLSSSLFGLGGGVAVVPILYVSFTHIGFQQDLVMHMAVGTSLAVMVVTALDAAYSHQRSGDVLWGEVRKLAPFVALGALAASISAHLLPTHALRVLFIVMLLVVILRALFKKGFDEDYALEDFEPYGRSLSATFGLANGALSALVGVGGGTFTVPFLRRAKLRMVNAVSISATLAAPVALCGSVGYVISGWHATGLPDWSTGYIYWPAVVGLIVGILVAVPQGTKLSHRLSDHVTARCYLAFLVVALVAMLF